jgi:hypothetical protein
MWRKTAHIMTAESTEVTDMTDMTKATDLIEVIDTIGVAIPTTTVINDGDSPVICD